jgi:hypothetical protein
MKNKLCVLAGIVLLLALTACEDTTWGMGGASYSIEGTVDIISGASPSPSPEGADVRLKQSGVDVGGAVADEDGSFDIRGVAAGNYTIEVTLGGYESGSTGVIKVSRNISGMNLALIPGETSLIYPQEEYGGDGDADAVTAASGYNGAEAEAVDDADAVSGASASAASAEIQIPATAKARSSPCQMVLRSS